MMPELLITFCVLRPMGSIDQETNSKVSAETRRKVQEPPMYKVLLHNDDYTTMDFVVEILIVIFKKSQEEAVRVMLNVHQDGVGICGVYPFETAETKVESVHLLASENGFPLKCSMEKE